MVAWAGDDRIVLVFPERGEGEDMAGKLLGAVLDRIQADRLRLGNAEFRVLVALAENANAQDREARMSTRIIGERIGLSQTAVVKALRRLENAMWITQTRRAAGVYAARYSLNLPSKTSEHQDVFTKRTPQSVRKENNVTVNTPECSERTPQGVQSEHLRVTPSRTTPSPPNCEAEFGGVRKLEGDAALRSALEAGSAPRPHGSGVNGNTAPQAVSTTSPAEQAAEPSAAATPETALRSPSGRIDMRIGLASKAIREHLYAGDHEFDQDFGEDIAVLDDFMRPAGLDGAHVAAAIGELADRHRLAPCSFHHAVSSHGTELRELVAVIAQSAALP